MGVPQKNVLDFVFAGFTRLWPHHHTVLWMWKVYRASRRDQVTAYETPLEDYYTDPKRIQLMKSTELEIVRG